MKKFWGAISRILSKGTSDHLPAYAAQTAFFVLLSFFPFIMMLIMAAVNLPFARQNIISGLLQALPDEFHGYITVMVDDIIKPNGGYTIITVLLAFWSAGKGIQALTNGLDQIYGLKRKHGFVDGRIVSGVYTIIFLLLCISLIILNAFGNEIAIEIINSRPDLTNATTLVLSIKGALTFVVFWILIMCMYYFLPSRKKRICKGRFKRQFFGALFAAFVWMAMTRGFAVYMRIATKSSYMYGSLTSVIVILIWLYIGVQIIMYGAEFNSLRGELFSGPRLDENGNVIPAVNEELEGEEDEQNQEEEQLDKESEFFK